MAGYHEGPTARPPRGGSTAMIHVLIGFVIGSLVTGAAPSAMRPPGYRYSVR
jgi:hypothetical protein